jgi:hypothetical protein
MQIHVKPTLLLIKKQFLILNVCGLASFSWQLYWKHNTDSLYKTTLTSAKKSSKKTNIKQYNLYLTTIHRGGTFII